MSNFGKERQTGATPPNVTYSLKTITFIKSPRTISMVRSVPLCFGSSTAVSGSGSTSNIAVLVRFNVQHRILPDLPELPNSCEFVCAWLVYVPASSTSALAVPQLSIQPFGKLPLSLQVLVPQRWFTPLRIANNETVLMIPVTCYSDENYADYGAKTVADSPAAFCSSPILTTFLSPLAKHLPARQTQCFGASTAVSPFGVQPF